MQGGSYSTVYDTFAAVDTNLTSINSSLDTITTGGGIKYFHTNSTKADSVATGTDSTAIGPTDCATCCLENRRGWLHAFWASMER